MRQIDRSVRALPAVARSRAATKYRQVSALPEAGPVDPFAAAIILDRS